MNFKGFLPEAINKEAEEEYFAFIEKCKECVLHPLDNLHRHHIVPRCFLHNKELEADASNLIWLTSENHTEAHRLLSEAYQTNGLRLSYNLLLGDVNAVKECRSIASRKGQQRLRELREQTGVPYHTKKWIKEHKLPEPEPEPEPEPVSDRISFSKWLDSVVK